MIFAKERGTGMSRSRHTEAQMIAALKQVEAGEAALRVSAIACAAATKRRTSEPQETTSDLPRGGTNDSAEEAQALCASRATAADLDGSESGVGAGFCARCGGMWASDPGAECGGRVHTRGVGLGSRHPFCQPEGDPR